MPTARKHMKLAVFLAGDSNYHAMGWQHPEAYVDAGSRFDRWIELARTCENAKLDMIFIADTLAIIGGDNLSAITHSAKVVRLEPLTLLSALAPLTRNIGLAATCATSYSEPYTVARMFASLDHLSGGRAGWNLVTGGQAEEAKNFSLERHAAHADRYARANEFADVVLGLWDSFAEDALLYDREQGKFFDAAKVRVLDHRGTYFSVKGPLPMARTPQGRPVIIQAGASDATIDLSARVADVVFTSQAVFEESRSFYDKVKSRAVAFGRSAEDIKVMPGLSVYVARTHAEAQDKFDYLHSMIDVAEAIANLGRLINVDLSGYRADAPMPTLPGNDLRMSGPLTYASIGRDSNLTLAQVAIRATASKNHGLIVGDAKEVADHMERWFVQKAADGFNLLPPTVPTSLTDFTTLVVPELQRRGLFRTEYEGPTLRENLHLSKPVRANLCP